MASKNENVNFICRAPTMNPKKSPKTSPLSSPRENTNKTADDLPKVSNENRKSPDRQNVNLRALLKALSVEKEPVQEPEILKNTDIKNIEVFLKQVQDYRNKGGEQSLFQFIDKSILSVICDLELQDKHATELDVWNFLQTECKPTSPAYLVEVLNTEVGIDPKVIGGKAKLQDLFASFKRTVDKLGLDVDGEESGEFIYSFDNQKQLLLSKLPPAFLEEYNVWLTFKATPTTHVQLYKQLLEVEKQ